MRSQLLKTTLLLGLLGICLAACQAFGGTERPSATPSGQALEGALWRMQNYMAADGALVEALPLFPVTAIFQAGNLRGSDGCNQYFASYRLDGSQIEIQPGGTTQMACYPQAVMNQAAGYRLALGYAAAFAVNGDQLIFYNGEGQPVLSFTREAQAAGDEKAAAPLSAPGSPLEGSTWGAISYHNGKQSGTAILPGAELTAIFDPFGKLSGLAGCNHYQALFEALPGASDAGGAFPLQIWAATTSQEMCTSPQGVMEQELLFLAALQQTAAYRLVDEELILFDAGGSEVARFARR